MESSSELFEYCVTDEYEGMRIDKLISELIDSLSRTYIKRLIDECHKEFIDDCLGKIHILNL